MHAIAVCPTRYFEKTLVKVGATGRRVIMISSSLLVMNDDAELKCYIIDYRPTNTELHFAALPRRS